MKKLLIVACVMIVAYFALVRYLPATGSFNVFNLGGYGVTAMFVILAAVLWITWKSVK